MFYQPDLIVYLWLAPVFTIFILPLLHVPLEILWKKLFVARVLKTENIRPVNSYIQNRTDDKREHQRLEINGIVAHVSDGVNYCAGSVGDISKGGICLVNPSDALDNKANRLGVLLTGMGKSFQLEVKPKWNNDSSETQSFGATIEDSLWSWEEFKRHLADTQPVKST